MSKERFNWLENEDKKDIIKTKGTESNVKEIYDACNELEKDKNNDIIINLMNIIIMQYIDLLLGLLLKNLFLKLKVILI